MSLKGSGYVLVTGLTGFVGRHIVALKEQLYKEYGFKLLTAQTDYDLCDVTSLDRLLKPLVPDAVIHLAAQSNVPMAFKNPEETIRVNMLGTLNLLQALDRCHFNGRLLYVSSGDIYGAIEEGNLPITEDYRPRPRNPYAVSKASSELLCLQWALTSSYEIIIARPFNHIGPGQSPDFVIPSIAHQIAQAKGLGQILVGDMDVTRDFLDVRDVIHAYSGLLTHGKNRTIYNVCSGSEYRLRDLAEKLIQISGKTLTLVSDPSRYRPAEQRRVCGSNELIRQDTGWSPRYPLDKTLQHILESTLSDTN